MKGTAPPSKSVFIRVICGSAFTRMPRMRRFVIAIVASLLAAAASAQLSEAVIDKDARDTIAAWHLPGLAIAVVQNDRVIFVKGYGIKEAGRRDRVRADTLL